MMVLRSWLPFTSRLRQRKGLAFPLCRSMKASIASRRSLFVLKLAPLSVLRCRRPKTISIWFHQLAEVGVK
jgi:hypothetical protein